MPVIQILLSPHNLVLRQYVNPNLFKFSTAATEHGCRHEDQAIETSENFTRKKHIGYRTIKCGVFINKQFPWLHATPDFLSWCKCCGYGCGEGNSHWVCVSSIGCLPGIVNLYDSLYNNIIEREVETQVVDLVGEEHLKGITGVPGQQQPNGNDCSVFAYVFSTCLVHYQTPETLQLDRSMMHQHLLECLVAGKMTLFATI